MVLSALAAVVGAVNGTCPYPTTQFFANVDVYLFGPGPGSLDIWNASVYYAHDGTSMSERYDVYYHDRALSSGAFFYGPYSDMRVSAGGQTYTIDKEGNCTSAASTVVSDACVGSIARFLPRQLVTNTDWATSETDAFLGHSAIDGVAVSVYGWNATCDGTVHTPVDKTHRVYIDDATNQPVLEVMGVRLGCSSYPAHAYAKFSTPENIQGSFSYMVNPGHMFAKPAACPGEDAPLKAFPPTPKPSATAGCANGMFDQCGGRGFDGSTCCPEGTVCTAHSVGLSQCVPKSFEDATWSALFA